MIVYRLSKSEYANDLSGSGARKAGGRWNSKGTAMIYTAESRALCTAEIAVHLPLGNIPKNYCMVSIEIPASIEIKELKVTELSRNWKSFPYIEKTQEIGDQFNSENRYTVIKVPSAVVPGDFNYLLNPGHVNFPGIRIIQKEPFNFDERLFIK
jgi:RES domain-containing protein